MLGQNRCHRIPWLILSTILFLNKRFNKRGSSARPGYLLEMDLDSHILPLLRRFSAKFGFSRQRHFDCGNHRLTIPGSPGQFFEELTVLRLVLRESMRPVALGMMVELAASAAASRFLTAPLFGLSSLDPFAFAGVSAFLCTVAFLASYIPARRATSVDPMQASR